MSFTIDPSASTTSLSYNYLFNNSFNASPAIALGISDLILALQDFTLNYLDANYFSVVPLNVQGAGLSFQFDFTAAVWSKIRVNFWATTNNQIQIGTFKLGIFQCKHR